MRRYGNLSKTYRWDLVLSWGFSVGVYFTASRDYGQLAIGIGFAALNVEYYTVLDD